MARIQLDRNTPYVSTRLNQFLTGCWTEEPELGLCILRPLVKEDFFFGGGEGGHASTTMENYWGWIILQAGRGGTCAPDSSTYGDLVSSPHTLAPPLTFTRPWGRGLVTFETFRVSVHHPVWNLRQPIKLQNISITSNISTRICDIITCVQIQEMSYQTPFSCMWEEGVRLEETIILYGRICLIIVLAIVFY